MIIEYGIVSSTKWPQLCAAFVLECKEISFTSLSYHLRIACVEALMRPWSSLKEHGCYNMNYVKFIV